MSFGPLNGKLTCCGNPLADRPTPKNKKQVSYIWVNSTPDPHGTFAPKESQNSTQNFSRHRVSNPPSFPKRCYTLPRTHQNYDQRRQGKPIKTGGREGATVGSCKESVRRRTLRHSHLSSRALPDARWGRPERLGLIRWTI